MDRKIGPILSFINSYNDNEINVDELSFN